MKKAFTLIEIMLVVIIIMIMMLITLNLGWNYIKNIQFRNDKEDFLSSYNKISSKTLSSSYYEGKKYSEFVFSVYNGKNFIDMEAISGANKVLLGRQYFNISVLSGDFMTGNFYFKSYELGCKFMKGSQILTGGNVSLRLNSTYNSDKYCFNINLGLCKLSQQKCF